jgi:hypothetical protein
MVNEDGNIEFIVPYNPGKALSGSERLLGVISRANKMGYVFGKDFEVGFEFYCGIRESSPSDFVIYKGSRAAKDTVFKGYMRGLSRMRSQSLIDAVKRFKEWRRQPDFPGWNVFHYYEGHQMAHMDY